MTTTTSTNSTATTTYYVVETRYCGPNPFENADYDWFEIRTTPQFRIGGDRGPCTEGWCGSWNDSSYYGHGCHSSLDEAVEAVKDLCGGEYRKVAEDEHDDIDVVAAYKPGWLAPMNRRNLADYVAAAFEVVDSSTSDAEIEAISSEYLEEAEGNGYTFDMDVLIEWLEDHRAEQEAEEE